MCSLGRVLINLGSQRIFLNWGRGLTFGLMTLKSRIHVKQSVTVKLQTNFIQIKNETTDFKPLRVANQIKKLKMSSDVTDLDEVKNILGSE